ncbi:MAG: restriction endonuclease [Nostoc sp.]|uniref:restriction endonuclease n=1 Tax=Nostoc sp. TaxID=1180 RepID=UPI002FF983FC
MPTPSTSDLPIPKFWDEFEDIVWEIYTRQWQDPYAQRYGRNGQAQNGIDIYGQQNGSGSYVAVQCKRYQDKKLNKRTILAEVKKAETFSSPISKYIIATTVSRDTKIQDYVRLLNEKRKSENLFSIHLIFWEDICNYLADISNHDLLKKYYSEWEKIFTTQPIIQEKQNISTQYPLNILLAKKFCECVDYLGVFLNYFLANELGYEESEQVVNNTICTVSQSYDPNALEVIISIFEKNDLMQPSNKGELSWQEFLITAFERIYIECESLLTKYGGSGSPELILELDRIKDVSKTMIDFTSSSSSVQETDSRGVRQKAYAKYILKDYFLEVIRARILAIQYLISFDLEAKIQPKVLPGENLKVKP